MEAQYLQWIVRAQPLGYTPEGGVLWYVRSYHWRRSIIWCLLYWICSSIIRYCRLAMGYPIPFERLLHLSHPQYTLEVTHWLLSVCIFSNFSKVRAPLLEPMQLGNYKLGRQKLLAALYEMGACHTDFPGIPLGGPSIFLYVTRQTDMTKKTDWQCDHLLYLCENYFF